MAITYPLSLPSAAGVRGITLRAANVVAVAESPFTLRQQVIRHPGQRWEASVSLPPMQRANAEEWVAFLLALRGREGTFLLGDPSSAGPRGAVLDIRNLATFSEPTSNAQTSNRNGITYVAGFDGFAGAVQFGDNSFNRWAYVGPALQPSTVYTVSVFVRMDDGGAPVLGSGSGADFRVVAGNRAEDSGTVTHLGGGLYRCHEAITTLTSNLANSGVSKTTANSDRGFRVTGYQIELGDVTPTAYQRRTGAIVQVRTAATPGASALALKGLPGAEPAFLPGDYLQLGAAGTATLHKVLLPVAPDASGHGTAEIWPAVRRTVNVDEAVVADNPRGRFRLAGNLQEWQIDVARFYGISFDAVEAVA